ncbi:sigma-E factor negative regulatory protein [Piscinibacter sakaiensis]|uniref:sigma-E factor negative regulatory protein n=1 Tax=Piscinibacter sakaiensis TaxID=1547922 RepID=UPI003AADBD8B
MNSSDGAARANEQMSALADGELGAAEVKAAIDEWHADPQARRAWHDYHLIGDVLRSDDLAAAAPGDADFLAAVRSRLAAEPTILAPTAAPMPVAAPNRQRSSGGGRRFASYAAMAAGFLVVVAGTLTITGLPFSTNSGPDAAIAEAPRPAIAPPTALAGAGDTATDPMNQIEVASGQLIRDARLDRYFAAHHQWSSNPMLGGHAAYLRPAPNDAAGR